MKTTIKDVAQRAGVSPSTVSRVIHHNDRISEPTRVRVFQAMEELQYHPNAMASSLASRSTHTLGLILPNSTDDLFVNPFFISAMRGISVYAQPGGYKIMYTFSRSEEEELQYIHEYIQSQWVDGIILFTAREKDRCVQLLREKQFPFVVIGKPEASSPDSDNTTAWVDNDNFQAMYKVVNHLLDRGKSRIAFVGGPAKMQVTRNRLAGYRQALINRGIQPRPELILTGSDFSENTGYSCMHQLLDTASSDAGGPRIDGVAATDDLLAFGILHTLEEQGFADIAVTGFNNSQRGAYQHPTLTTVDIRPETLGTRAAELLIKKLQGEPLPHNNYIVETELIPRESSAPRQELSPDQKLVSPK